MIKVNYDIETTLVKGYYLDSINYASIPEPFIEIEDNAQVLDKQMCVVNGIYQEYVKPSNVLLQEAKKAKTTEIKAARDSANLVDMVDHQAIELIEQDGEWVEGELVYFTFQVKATNNPATEPSTILLTTVMQGAINPAYFLRYSCKIGDRKGYVKLNAAVASSLMNHAKIRNENNIKHCNDLEIEIANATTIEQVNAISF